MEIATGTSNVITQIPDNMMDRFSETLLELVDEGAIEIIVTGQETIEEVSQEIPTI